MDQITLDARAKINLTLDCLSKRESGYHDVRMVMQQIDLFDTITIRKASEAITISTSVVNLPCDEDNICYKAAQLMMSKHPEIKGVSIHIEKRIPIAAGLAGGSTDAAAVFIGMNTIYNLGYTKNELMEMSYPLGADIPFCILGNCALAEGIGERLTPVKGLKDQWLIVVKPNFGVSTKEVYEAFDVNALSYHPDTDGMLAALEDEDFYEVCQRLSNVLEDVTLKRYPKVKLLKDNLKSYGPKGILMSGSGPTVFAFYKDYSRSLHVYKKMKKSYNAVFLVKTYNEE